MGKVQGAKDRAIDTFGEEFQAPDYTIKDILDAIPQECYKRSLVKSFGYLFRDLFFVGLFGYIAVSYIQNSVGGPSQAPHRELWDQVNVRHGNVPKQPYKEQITKQVAKRLDQ